MDYKTILFDLREGVAHLTLNRPDAANSINLESSQELYDAMLRCDEDPAVRAVLVAGSGKMFCAGGDLKSFAARKDDLPAHLKLLTHYIHGAVSLMARMDAPVITAVNGTVAGGGLGLVFGADLVIAAESARFTMAYTRAALSPDASTSFFLPRLVGLRRALDLTLTNRVLSAREALEWGIVNRVVPESELAAAAQALAKEMAEGPTAAFGAAKRLLRDSFSDTLETHLQAEARAIADRSRNAEAREGISAFLEKRAPHYREV
ncbi:MAG TPA: enoyl-CoA hydratase-related protein [Candidatus Binataceae bacterium]|jgi:2-(1,2-epoxy-1,2-dihydrophenyl)acetyl-CoA isomerase|nr:enoyl-CoA hydratase-related protein [Candidatus Binataceae bacterium]